MGRLVYLGGDTDKPLALVGELCPAEAFDQDMAWRKAWLAGEALVEMGLNRVQDSALGQDLWERVRSLADLLRLRPAAPVERAAAGRALGAPGDPRPGVGLDPASEVPDIAWCDVPAGPFVMGSPDDSLALFGKETPQQTLYLAAFRGGKYPITNAQYGGLCSRRRLRRA